MRDQPLRVSLGGLTDIGIVREENQDALLIHEPEDPEVRARQGILVALADGMGGLEGGSTASRIAVDAVRESYYADTADPRASIESAVKAANGAIFRHSRDVEGGRQMGSTLTALVILGDRAYVAQVGDSRAYCARKGTFTQVTRDHSLVRELMDRGEIDESSATYSAHRNILTRGLGLREEVAVDVYELKDLEVGDTLLLSSDGLHGLVHEDEMAECLEKCGPNVKAVCQELVRVARDRGGPDNITVAVARLEELPGKPAAVTEVTRARRGDPRGWTLPLLVFLSFAAGVFLTLLLEDSSAPPVRLLDQLRREVDSALDAAGREADPEARASLLHLRLEQIRQYLEPQGAALEPDAVPGEEPR